MPYERTPTNHPHSLNSLLSTRDSAAAGSAAGETAPEQEAAFPRSTAYPPAGSEFQQPPPAYDSPQEQQRRIQQRDAYQQHSPGYDYGRRYRYPDAASGPQYVDYRSRYGRPEYDYNGVAEQQQQQQQPAAYAYEYDGYDRSRQPVRDPQDSYDQRHHYPAQQQQQQQQQQQENDYYYRRYDYAGTPAYGQEAVPVEYAPPPAAPVYYDDDQRRYEYPQSGSVPPTQPAPSRSDALQSPDQPPQQLDRKQAYNYDVPAATAPPEAASQTPTPYARGAHASDRAYGYDAAGYPSYPNDADYRSPAPGTHTHVFQRTPTYDTGARYAGEPDPYVRERGVYAEDSAAAARPVGMGITSLLSDAPSETRAVAEAPAAYDRYDDYGRHPRYGREYLPPTGEFHGYAEHSTAHPADAHGVMSISQLVGDGSRPEAEMPGVMVQERGEYSYAYARHTPDVAPSADYNMRTPPMRRPDAPDNGYNTEISPDVPLAKHQEQWPIQPAVEAGAIVVSDDEPGAVQGQAAANNMTTKPGAPPVIGSDDDNRPLASRTGFSVAPASSAEKPPTKRRKQGRTSRRRDTITARPAADEHGPDHNGARPDKGASGRRQSRKPRGSSKTELSREYVYDEDDEDDMPLEQSTASMSRYANGDQEVAGLGSGLLSDSAVHGHPADDYSVDENVQAYIHHVKQRTNRAVAKYEERAKRKSQQMHEHVVQRYGQYLNGYFDSTGERVEYSDDYALDARHREDYGVIDDLRETLGGGRLQPPPMGYFTPSQPISPRGYEYAYDRGTPGSAASEPLALLAAEGEASGLHRDHSGRPSLWVRLATEHIPRAYRHMQSNVQVRNNNMRKVIHFCQREVKRVYGPAPTRAIQLNPQQPTITQRPPKELLMRARRGMREMLMFWKRYEKEEREMRKRAEREAAERQRQEEEAREERRQNRKLNFLITQTELYSHFIGNKIQDGAKEAADSDGKELKEIDFDAADDAALDAHARQSAHNALAQQQAQTREFDEVRRKQRAAASDDSSEDANVADALDTMNFQEPETLGTAEIAQPRMLMCQLKEYQLKGLNWLANLYEQGINGILADEMGLGKTVQSISLLAYLAETHNIWGPFIVVAPASTLHNWEQELKRFVPEFKVLPYWGTPKERKVLRKSLWNPKNLSRKDSEFHVLVTSYQLIITDESYLNRVKWQYMVLDEAQAIKSSSSTRWKTLLGFHCRNRLLLTGTPIQNSMQELWALLHFIMPTLFDSHEEFSEWFSRDIEAHAVNNSMLDRHQLHRLHMILKPFMLRRNKRHVQHELGEKIERLISCDLTQRQKTMYRGLMSKISLSELLEQTQSNNNVGKGKGNKDDNNENLMNLVMQFRKVCSHPELFERAEVDSPLVLGATPSAGSLAREGDEVECSYALHSAVEFRMPKLLYRDSLVLPRVQTARQGALSRFSLWSPGHIAGDNSPTSVLSLLRLCTPSASAATRAFTGTLAERLNDISEHTARTAGHRQYLLMAAEEKSAQAENPALRSPEPGSTLHALTNVFSPQNLDVSQNLAGLARVTQTEFAHSYMSLVLPAYKPATVAPPADLVISDRSATWENSSMLLRNPLAERLSCGRESMEDWSRPFRSQGLTNIWMPSKDKLIRYSGKMAALDKLLVQLKQEGHRVLLYFQMTKMIDLFEEYLAYRKYTYLRLDGSSKIADRRDMVMDWQTRDDIFIFLLTTRAGGLGINLTAADTVIFFECDWNPTVDSQAMDRAHRMGQTKQVVVYRLITRGTIEERILQRARQKDEIHRIVIAGGSDEQAGQDGAEAEDLSTDAQPSSREIVSWLLGETADDGDAAISQRLEMARRAQDTSNHIYGISGRYPGELDASALVQLEGDVWSQVVPLPPPNLSRLAPRAKAASEIAVDSAFEAAIWEQKREVEQRRRERQRQAPGRGRGGRRGGGSGNGGQGREKRKARGLPGVARDGSSQSRTQTPEPSKRQRASNGPSEADTILASAATPIS